MSGNITHLSLPPNYLGLDLKTARQVYSSCKLTVRRILNSSPNNEIRRLFSLTSTKNTKIDDVIAITIKSTQPIHVNKRESNRVLKMNNLETVWNKFMDLSEQSKIISFVLNISSAKDIRVWKLIISNLPANIFRFCRRYLVLSLANASNLRRWKISPTGNCSLCNQLQTQLHVFNNCTRALDRYVWRHDSILFTISEYLKSAASNNYTIFIDCNALNYPTPNQFLNKRPDIILQNEHQIIVIELTCPFETNLKSSREYKANKYKDLKDLLLVPCDDLKLILLEISSLGFVSKDISEFKKLLKDLNCDADKVLSVCSQVAIRCSYFIYCRRNKIWPEPDILRFS